MGDEPIAEQGGDGEDMVSEAAGVGVMLSDAPTGRVISSPSRV